MQGADGRFGLFAQKGQRDVEIFKRYLAANAQFGLDIVKNLRDVIWNF